MGLWRRGKGYYGEKKRNSRLKPLKFFRWFNPFTSGKDKGLDESRDLFFLLSCARIYFELNKSNKGKSLFLLPQIPA